MVAPQTKPMSFDEFLEWYPEDGKNYELIEGVIVEMFPTGSHEDVAGFLIAELNWEIRRQDLPYSILKNCLLKPLAPRSGYIPDVAVINRTCIKDEPLWNKSSVIQHGHDESGTCAVRRRVSSRQTVSLVIEIVSTNWRDDYGHKFVEYEAMGIVEYWIVDYKALGAVRYIGKPKQPTVTICKLLEEEYQIEKFVKGESINSVVFPELQLTAEAIFQSANI